MDEYGKYMLILYSCNKKAVTGLCTYIPGDNNFFLLAITCDGQLQKPKKRAHITYAVKGNIHIHPFKCRW